MFPSSATGMKAWRPPAASSIQAYALESNERDVVQVEAYMFGSVPLKTYLPDGDIDLAVFQGKGPRLRDMWTSELSALLEAEGRNPQNPHRVKDVQIINAEVWALGT